LFLPTTQTIPQRLQGLVLKTAASGPRREPFVCQRLHLLTPLSSKASTKSVISRTQARSLNLWNHVMLMLLTIRYVRGFYRGRYTWSMNYPLPAMSLGVSSNSWPLSPIRRKFLAKLKKPWLQIDCEPSRDPSIRAQEFVSDTYHYFDIGKGDIGGHSFWRTWMATSVTLLIRFAFAAKLVVTPHTTRPTHHLWRR
jgi:hypothetical protein